MHEPGSCTSNHSATLFSHHRPLPVKPSSRHPLVRRCHHATQRAQPMAPKRVPSTRRCGRAKAGAVGPLSLMAHAAPLPPPLVCVLLSAWLGTCDRQHSDRQGAAGERAAHPHAIQPVHCPSSKQSRHHPSATQRLISYPTSSSNKYVQCHRTGREPAAVVRAQDKAGQCSKQSST